MSVFIDLQIELENTVLPNGTKTPVVRGFDVGTVFPQYMTVDYYRYYQLRKDCGNYLFVNNTSDLLNFYSAPSIKRSIIIGNSTGEITINSNENKILKTIEGITINNNFAVNLGVELTVLISPCE